MGVKFHKGMPKPPGSGRQKGTPNKKKVLKVADYLSEKDIHPIQMILAELDNLESRDKVKVLLELQSYCESKPKESEQEPAPPSELDEALENADTDTLLSLVKKPDEGA